jgi:hypothetical protein
VNHFFGKGLKRTEVMLSIISNALSLITVSATGFAKHVQQVGVGSNRLLSTSENRETNNFIVIAFFRRKFHFW